MDKTIEFSQVVDKCCGLDVHKKVIVATVEGTGISHQMREFESTTRSLTELKEWLLELGVTHVAMESTGVYWKPVINVLELAGFTLLVVNAQHIKYVPGQEESPRSHCTRAIYHCVPCLEGSACLQRTRMRIC